MSDFEKQMHENINALTGSISTLSENVESLSETVGALAANVATRKDVDELSSTLTIKMDQFVGKVRKDSDPIATRVKDIEDYLRSHGDFMPKHNGAG